MAAGFIEGFARWLDQQAGDRGAASPTDGARADPGRLVRARRGTPAPRPNRCDSPSTEQPEAAAPPVRRRAAGRAWPERRASEAVGVVLTGMGRTAPSAPRRSVAPAACSSPRTRPPRSSTGCRARSPRRAPTSSCLPGGDRRRPRPPCSRPRDRVNDPLKRVAELVERESGIQIKEPQEGALAAALGRASQDMDVDRFLGALDDPAQQALLLDRLIDQVAIQETFFMRESRELEAIDWHQLLAAAHARGASEVSGLGRAPALRARRPTRWRCWRARPSATVGRRSRSSPPTSRPGASQRRGGRLLGALHPRAQPGPPRALHGSRGGAQRRWRAAALAGPPAPAQPRRRPGPARRRGRRSTSSSAATC